MMVREATEQDLDRMYEWLEKKGCKKADCSDWDSDLPSVFWAYGRVVLRYSKQKFGSSRPALAVLYSLWFCHDAHPDSNISHFLEAIYDCGRFT